MQLFMIAKVQTGEGKDLKTEYQVAGNVSLIQAQQMLTEATITFTKAEAIEQAKIKAEDSKH